MSETEVQVEEQRAASVGESAYKVVFLKLDDQGVPVLWQGKPVARLNTKIYDRRTALRYAAHAAQSLPTDSVAELLVAVITPGGRCFAVLSGGTGKPVRTLVAFRTKKTLAMLMPNEVVTRRRTSRPMVSRPAKRRTSRAPARGRR